MPDIPIDLSNCACCPGHPTCCNKPRPPSVTVTTTSVGTSGCACIGTQVLPWNATDDIWELKGVAVCFGTPIFDSMDFLFTCFYDGTFWYWALELHCNFSGTGIAQILLSSPMMTEPDCCPIDVVISGALPNTFGACCGGTLPYSGTFHITAACP